MDLQTLDAIKAMRQGIIKKAVDNNRFNTIMYSLYFQTTKTQIKHDLKELNLKPKEIPFNEEMADKLLGFRDTYYDKLKEMSDYNNDDIKCILGMWHLPLTPKRMFYTNYSEKLTTDDLTKASVNYYANKNEDTLKELISVYANIVPKYDKAITYYTQMGVPLTDLKGIMGWTTTEAQRFSDSLKLLNIPTAITDLALSKKEIRELVEEIHTSDKYYNKQVSAFNYLGLSSIHNYKFDKETKSLSKQYKPADKSRNIKSEEFEKKCFDMYYNMYGTNHGYTQQEIADELGVTYPTVLNAIKQYKIKHIDETDPTQLFQSRHRGKAHAERRLELEKTVTKLYDDIIEKEPDISMTKLKKTISKQADCSENMVQTLLEETGKIDLKLKDFDPKTFHETKVGHDERGQFGKGATRVLLDEPDYQENDRYKILHRQRQAQSLLRNAENAKQSFEQDGNFKKVLEIVRNIDEENNRETEEQTIEERAL